MKALENTTLHAYIDRNYKVVSNLSIEENTKRLKEGIISEIENTISSSEKSNSIGKKNECS